MRESMMRWAKALPPDAHGRPVEVYLPEVAFEAAPEARDREFLNEIPTTFNLPDETVDRLIESGRRLLREAPNFQRLRAALQAGAR